MPAGYVFGDEVRGGASLVCCDRGSIKEACRVSGGVNGAALEPEDGNPQVADRVTGICPPLLQPGQEHQNIRAADTSYPELGIPR
jgi:hypothetical protein